MVLLKFLKLSKTYSCYVCLINYQMDPLTYDQCAYDSLVSNTKLAFTTIEREIGEPTFPAYFNQLLEDCEARISQSLGLITDILQDSDVHRINLIDYMKNSVSLLHLLSEFIKNIIDTVSLACRNMKTFPTTLGHIITNVFIHCKDSVTLYGSDLNHVEKQLKELFRTCHELQLTYLMVLEKHFIFDLTDREEQNILMEVLDINLKIGDVVQCLDGKTTAEQWKAYTAICEKYSTHLMDKSIYDETVKVLCSMAVKNIQTALEPNQDEKIILRSLKVSRFTLKILLRICGIFKHALIKDQRHILELLFFIYLNNREYLETIAQKPAQFIILFDTDIMSSTHSLLAELMVDEKFVNCVITYSLHKIRKDDKVLGFIILVQAIIKLRLQLTEEPTVKFRKEKIIDLIFTLLPHCHVWFNMDLKFKLGPQHTCGLYEHLLTHAVALVKTMTSDEFIASEKRMLEALLSTDSYSALFSSNLWRLLARSTGRQLLLNQVVVLCKTYQTLEHNYMFRDSPQQIHLASTISYLFQGMPYEDKTKLYNLYDINDDKNTCLWSVLKISNLPTEVRGHAEKIVVEKFKLQFRKLNNETIPDIEVLVRIMNLASTCKLVNTDEEITMLIMNAWTKCCPRNNGRLAEAINKRTVWYYKFVSGLVMVTNTMDNILRDSGHLVKVLHTISEIVQSGSMEIKLPLINILCRIANKQLSVPIATKIFRALFHDENVIVRNKLFNDLRHHASYNLDRIISKVINEDVSLRTTWVHFEKHGTLNENTTKDTKLHLQAVMDIKYSHKCLDDGDQFRESDFDHSKKVTSTNFDFADIDTLFDTDSVAEPANKKARLNTEGVVDEIISRLEEDTAALCKIKENILTAEYQKRIKKICNKLANTLE